MMTKALEEGHIPACLAREQGPRADRGRGVLLVAGGGSELRGRADGEGGGAGWVAVIPRVKRRAAFFVSSIYMDDEIVLPIVAFCVLAERKSHTVSATERKSRPISREGALDPRDHPGREKRFIQKCRPGPLAALVAANPFACS